MLNLPIQHSNAQVAVYTHCWHQPHGWLFYRSSPISGFKTLSEYGSDSNGCGSKIIKPQTWMIQYNHHIWGALCTQHWTIVLNKRTKPPAGQMARNGTDGKLDGKISSMIDCEHRCPAAVQPEKLVNCNFAKNQPKRGQGHNNNNNNNNNSSSNSNSNCNCNSNNSNSNSSSIHSHSHSHSHSHTAANTQQPQQW